jgi:hypothetical protein
MAYRPIWGHRSLGFLAALGAIWESGCDGLSQICSVSPEPSCGHKGYHCKFGRGTSEGCLWILARGTSGFCLGVPLGGGFLEFPRKFVVSGRVLIDSRQYRRVFVARRWSGLQVRARALPVSRLAITSVILRMFRRLGENQGWQVGEQRGCG